MGFHRQRTVWLWRNPDNFTHRQLLSIDQIWRQSTALIWSRWGCRRLADNIWLLAHDNNNNNCIVQYCCCSCYRWLSFHCSVSLLTTRCAEHTLNVGDCHKFFKQVWCAKCRWKCQFIDDYIYVPSRLCIPWSWVNTFPCGCHIIYLFIYYEIHTHGTI